MKVIKHGNTYNEIECPKCKARLGFLNKEIQEEYYEDSPFFGSHWRQKSFIKCVECENIITLKLIIDGKVNVYMEEL